MSSPPKFIADAMLGSLARKLRIFGFDTLYFGEGSDAELEALARRERRIVLTSDKALCLRARSEGLKVILVEGRTDRARLLIVRDRAGPGLTSRAGLASRCAVCNGQLETVKRSAAAGSVPSRVLARHRLFFRCTSCSKFYWRGGHWVRLRRLSRSVKTKDLT